MLIGTIAAMCHGIALPLLMFYFGDLTDAFINQAGSESLGDPGNFNSDFIVQCAITSVSQMANVSISNATDAVRDNISTGSVNCDATAFGVTFAELLDECFSSSGSCLDESAFLDEINMQVLIFCMIGLGVLISSYFQISFYLLASERQVRKIRLLFYRAILKQEIGWFDANPSGELSSRLTE